MEDEEREPSKLQIGRKCQDAKYSPPLAATAMAATVAVSPMLLTPTANRRLRPRLSSDSRALSSTGSGSHSHVGHKA